MRRLAQLATLLLFAAALVTPIAEYFDRWDSAGLANDTEFAIFALILTLTFVLVVCALLAQAAMRFSLLLASMFKPRCGRLLAALSAARLTVSDATIVLPLRI